MRSLANIPESAAADGDAAAAGQDGEGDEEDEDEESDDDDPNKTRPWCPATRIKEHRMAARQKAEADRKTRENNDALFAGDGRPLPKPRAGFDPLPTEPGARIFQARGPRSRTRGTRRLIRGGGGRGGGRKTRASGNFFWATRRMATPSCLTSRRVGGTATGAAACAYLRVGVFVCRRRLAFDRARGGRRWGSFWTRR